MHIVTIQLDKEKALKVTGVLVIALAAGSFTLMVLGPWIPNVAGEALDARFLEGLDARIDATRRAPLTVTFSYSNGTPLQGLVVEYNQTSHDFYFGCNFFGYEGCGSIDNNAKYKDFFKRTFNLAVLPFYWAYAEPEHGNLVQEPWLDSAIAWCQANNITVKGHPLVWSHQAGNPAWLPPEDAIRKDMIQERVQYIVDKYKGKVKIWDVVNEPAHWQPYYGTSKFDYVRDAFTWARAKDGSATLSINEYGVLGQDFGHGPYYNLIEQQLQAGTPITCIGIQGHEPRTDWFPATSMWSTFDGYKALGLPIHVTELMVTSEGFPITNSWKKGLWSEENQAEYLVRLYKTAFAHPSLEAVIYWELWEGMAWMQGAPLVKANWEPKLAYTRLSSLINDEWHSLGTSSTSSTGAIMFTGFFGNYSLYVPSLGQRFQASFPKAGARQVNITI